MNVAERSHAYRGIYRSWGDSSGQIGHEFIERLVGLWEWRLDRLEASEDARAEEALGLRWLPATPYVPAADALRLGRRTLELTGDDVPDRGASHWDRLAGLAESDAVGAYEIAERLIREAPARDYPYLPFESVAPTLAHALHSSDAQITGC